MPSRLLLASLVLLCAQGPTLSAEEPAPATPAERAERALAALPAPGSGARLVFEAEFVVDGNPLGPVRLALEPAEAGSGAAWIAVDELRVGPEGSGVHIREEARLDARLQVLDGKTVSSVPGEPRIEVGFTRDATGYAFTRREGDAAATTSHVPSPGTRTATLAAALFLAVHLPAEPAAYAFDILGISANLGEDPTLRARRGTLTVRGPETVRVGDQERKAPVVAVAREGAPEEDFLIVLSDDRARVVQVSQPGRKVVMRVAEPATPLDFAAPARSAKHAALQAARALACADLAAFEAVLNWETIDAQLARDPAYAPLDVPGRRAKLLEQVGSGLEKNPPALIEAVLRGSEDALVVEDLGAGRARVTFPPIFKSLKLVVKKVGEAWLLDELPGQP